MSPETAPVLDAMRKRRVCRFFTDERVSDEMLSTLLDAARWAPSASNQRINRFLVVRDPDRIVDFRRVAPGMLGFPTALLVILTDSRKAEEEGVKLHLDHRTRWADAGAASQNVLLAAHELGLGACPLMSFSVAGAASILELPEHLTPDYIVMLGHPVEAPAKRKRLGPKQDLSKLLFWDRAPDG
jgi:nitroreductase